MKPSVFMINTARGDLIDDRDLLAALRSGRLEGAEPDVFMSESDQSYKAVTAEPVALPNMGICRDLLSVPDLDIRPLGCDHRVVVVNADHPLAHKESVTLEETLDFEHVELSQNASLLTVSNRAAGDLSRELRVRLNVPSFDAALHVINSGLAIGILPIEAVGRFGTLYNVRIIPLAEEWATQKFVIRGGRANSDSRISGTLGA